MIKEKLHILKEKILNSADIIAMCSVAFVLIVACGIFVLHNNNKNVAKRNNEGVEKVVPVTPDPQPERPNAYKDLALTAKSAYVFDMTTGKPLFSKNADTPLPLASLTKIMTALTASALVSDNAQVTIDGLALGEEGDTGLFEGEHWSFKNLLDFTLLVSSNDGAKALAAASMAFEQAPNQLEGDRSLTFVDAMNAMAKKIGLNDTRFNNETGLDIDDATAGGYGSAKDMTRLIQYALGNAPEVFEATRYQAMNVASDDVLHRAENTNVILRSIPGIMFSKTGYSGLAGGNLAVAYDAGLSQPIIIVVLGSSYDARFSDMKALVGATQKYLTGETI